MGPGWLNELGRWI